MHVVSDFLIPIDLNVPAPFESNPISPLDHRLNPCLKGGNLLKRTSSINSHFKNRHWKGGRYGSKGNN